VATEVVSREAQREFPRWPITAAKAVRVDLGPAGSGQIVDISAGGMRVKMVAPLRREAEIPVRIDIPERSTPVQCSGIVVWSKPNGSAGIRFTKLTDEHKSILNSWLSALEQAASEGSPQRDEFARITAQIAAMKLNNADALSLIARRVSQLANASSVVIALGKAENMICLARSGEAPDLGTPIRPSSGLVGECIRGRKLVLVHDASSDPRADDFRQGSAVILPLLVNTELRGVLQVRCAQPHAFDTKTVEVLQKLSDAVVFVTHNVMPQPRIATVTALPKPAPSSAPPVTKPSDSGRLTAFSAPVAKPSDSGRFTAFGSPLKPVTPLSPLTTSLPAVQVMTPPPMVSERSSTVDVAPIAEPVQSSPVAVAARPSWESAKPVSITSSRPVAVLDSLPSYHPVPRSSSKAGVMIAAAVLLVAVPSGIYFWRQHRQQPVAVSAAAVSPATISPGLDSNVTVTPATQSSTTAASNIAPVSVAPVASVATPAAEKSSAMVEKPTAEKKSVVTESSPPPPAPMVLASARPVGQPKVEEPEATAPTTQLAMRATPSLPGIALPASASAPKLAAPVAKTWTGGTLIQRLSPVYPQAAISRGLEGAVQLQAVVTSKGVVEKIRAVSGNPVLVQAAIDAVKRWRYEPFKADGEPTDKEVSITLNFKIPR
jgi:protein TonB